MSIQDDINRLRQLAADERIPAEKIRHLQADLMQLNSEVKDTLGEGHGFYHGVGAVAARLSEQLDTAIALCMEYEEAIYDVSDALEGGS